MITCTVSGAFLVVGARTRHLEPDVAESRQAVDIDCLKHDLVRFRSDRERVTGTKAR